ncbi:ATP-binding protein [uncultured Bosea sp.]|uniref:ATP-binding protein n=1 Tax=uncultured Bosea sp. TaxID=211457 RepID=UPI0025E9BF42|nr:ATP-binding protein [uncultured Bosea sp.]
MPALRLLSPYLKTVALMAIATMVAVVVVWFAPLDSVSAIYMLPILVSAIRWGTGPAIAAALLGAFMTSLFYPPLFSPLVFEPAQMIDLATSLVVALTVGTLAGRMRTEMLRAKQNERTIRQVYELSSAILAANDVESVYDAVADHVSEALGQPVVLFVPQDRGALRTARTSLSESDTAALQSTVPAFLATAGGPGTLPVTILGHRWLLCRITSGQERPAALALRLNAADTQDHDEAIARIPALLAESARSLERLGLSQALAERKLRQRADELRDILVESVSHELRTPLAGIMGSASVLAALPDLAARPPLGSLATGIELEARRLDRLIQDVLDLGRIRAGALQPRLDTVDPADIVNDALGTAADRLRGRIIKRSFHEPLPLIRVDPVLLAQALVNVIENAAKYTQDGASIRIVVEQEEAGCVVTVSDDGAGLDAREAEDIFERFHRGERHADIAGGSGLGLTIARIFVEANGGRIIASSEGPNRGTAMRIHLPIAEETAGGDDHDR